MNKNNLRNKFMIRRENFSDDKIECKSQQLINKFLGSDFYKGNNSIFIYVSYKNEVQTHDLIKKMINDNKDVYVPQPNPETKEMEAVLIRKFNDLTEGSYGILEPIESSSRIEPSLLDLIIVPGLVFSLKGYRIGYGGGFYDRFLSRTNQNDCPPWKLGFAYNEFIIDKVPNNQYDLPVDFIISENKIIKCREYRG